MFKIGDKIKHIKNDAIAKIVDYNNTNNTFTITNFGIYMIKTPKELRINFTKVDSDADSSGLYGVDPSYWPMTHSTVDIPDKDLTGLLPPGTRYIDSHAAYKTAPVYTIPTDGSYIFTGLNGNRSDIIWMDKNAAVSKAKSQCECGALKTYGESCNPEFHQSYCEMSKK